MATIPTPEKNHRTKERVSEMASKGKIPASTKAKIDAKADKKLGHTAKQRTGKVRTWNGK